MFAVLDRDGNQYYAGTKAPRSYSSYVPIWVLSLKQALWFSTQGEAENVVYYLSTLGYDVAIIKRFMGINRR